MTVPCWRGSSGAGAALLSVEIDARSIAAAVVMKYILAKISIKLKDVLPEWVLSQIGLKVIWLLWEHREIPRKNGEPTFIRSLCRI